MSYVVSKKQGKIFNEISKKRTWGKWETACTLCSLRIQMSW